MQLETQVPPCIFFDWWFSPWELWGCCSFIGDPVLSLMDDYEHPLLY
ncbi:hypothetical protein T09_2450 [Trichinella sp. T9]|nr:hypothetical protein T09_2450 [Trichinella sp. T9]